MDTSKQEPPSAFSLYRDDIIQSVKRDNPDLRPNEITKLIAQKWVKCDETTRKEYEQKHQEIAENFEQEKKPKPEKSEAYEAPKKVTAMDVVNMLRPWAKSLASAKPPKQKTVKDSEVVDLFTQLKPKAKPKTEAKKEKVIVEKNISAFTLFKNDIMQKTKEENPDCYGNELTQLIAQQWVLSGEEVHQAYEKKLSEGNYLEMFEKSASHIPEGEYQYDVYYEEIEKPKKKVAEYYDTYYEEKKKSIPKVLDPEDYDSNDEEERYNDYPESDEEDEDDDEYYDDEDSYEEEEEYYEKPKKAPSKCLPVATTKTLKAPVKIIKKEEPLTAFGLFKNDNLEETQKENPECSMGEVLRIMAQKWTLSDDKLKEKYEQMCQNK